jgi:hypothetical protein
MAFVNEKISECDREYFYSLNLKSPFTDELVEPWKWTIDREREIFLVGLAGQGSEHSEIPMYYALVWKKNVIIIETFSGGTGSYSTGVEKWWRIPSIRIPECMAAEKDKVVELVKEAFDAHGSGYKRDHVKKVEFKHIASPFFIPEVK